MHEFLSFNYYTIRTVRLFFVELYKAHNSLTINSGRLSALPGSVLCAITHLIFDFSDGSK
jgi:hypothetical protein